jgi:PTS system galactitol-specific IIC component
MDSFLTGLKAAVDTLGATVLLPIVIFIIAVVLGAKVGKAFRAAITIGVAFIGINLVLGLMLGSIGDVAKAIVTNTGIQRDIVDVGWPSAAAIAFGSSVGLWVIPIGIAVNIALLLLRLTRTLNVDVWNFWHFAFVGSLATAATGSLGYGLAVAALVAALALLFADWSARAVQQFYGIPRCVGAASGLGADPAHRHRAELDHGPHSWHQQDQYLDRDHREALRRVR